MAHGGPPPADAIFSQATGQLDRYDRSVVTAHAGSRLDRRQFLYGLPLAVGSAMQTVAAAHAAVPAAEPIAVVRTVAEYREARLRLAKHRAATLIDIGAEWCAFCRTIDGNILRDATVVALLANVGFINVDVTAMDRGSRELLHHLRADGPPTVFIVETATGREYSGTRSVGSFPVDSLITRLRPFAG